MMVDGVPGNEELSEEVVHHYGQWNAISVDEDGTVTMKKSSDWESDCDVGGKLANQNYMMAFWEMSYKVRAHRKVQKWLKQHEKEDRRWKRMLDEKYEVYLVDNDLADYPRLKRVLDQFQRNLNTVIQWLGR